MFAPLAVLLQARSWLLLPPPSTVTAQVAAPSTLCLLGNRQALSFSHAEACLWGWIPWGVLPSIQHPPRQLLRTSGLGGPLRPPPAMLLDSPWGAIANPPSLAHGHVNGSDDSRLRARSFHGRCLQSLCSLHWGPGATSPAPVATGTVAHRGPASLLPGSRGHVLVATSAQGVA